MRNKFGYKVWILKNEPNKARLNVMKIESKSWQYRPLVSIITPAYNTDKNTLTLCIKSVQDQVYDNWELCLVDGGSDRGYVKEVIRAFAENDSRIKYAILSRNYGIAGNSNQALKLATGEYAGFLDHDDILAPFALYEVVRALNGQPLTDVIYSDEDKIPAHGNRRYAPFFKPEWSPDALLSRNYMCHFLLVRKNILEKIGGFREGYDGAQDHDLILRIVRETDRIKRIPAILYHWRASEGSAASDPDAKPYAIPSAKRAIGEYLIMQGIKAEVLDGLIPLSYRVKYKIQPSRKICIIIPTRDNACLLRKCISSILEKTEYKEFEVIIIDNQSIGQETIEYLERIRSNQRIKVLSYAKPFNYSAMNNLAVKTTDADHLLFLDNDTEVINSEWLSAMLEFSQRKDVGAVGARLCYPDDTIGHAGLILGIMGGIAGHSHRGFSRSSQGYLGRAKIIQNMSAVKGSCMMVRRDVFEEVGGFDEELSHAFNDVDLCLKIREKGYLIVYTPYAELYHHESACRGDEDTPEKRTRFARESNIMRRRWKRVLEAGDPYYNPNLTVDREDFSIRV